MYNLYDKNELNDRKCALLITDCTYNKEQFEKFCEGDFKKLFLQYDETLHIIHEGNSLSFPVIDNDIVREMTDTELVLSGNRVLRDGEKIEDGELMVISSPGSDYTWDGVQWIFKIEEKKISLLAEVEKEKARLLADGFLWKGLYQQRCRAEKDIPYIRETLENFNLIPEYSVKWFFSSHPEGYNFTTQEEFIVLRNQGMFFTGEVFRIESELKLRISSAAGTEDLAFNVEEEYNKGLAGFTLPG